MGRKLTKARKMTKTVIEVAKIKIRRIVSQKEVVAKRFCKY